MYYSISNALKKRFCLIFQEIFQAHAEWNKVDVFTKFPKQDRPKHALLVRSISGSSQKLSLDNFIATHRGYSTVANLKGIHGNSIEWVRDDIRNLDKLASPGYYVVTMTEKYKFKVQPFLNIINEELELDFIMGQDGAHLKSKPVNPRSEKILADTTLLKPNIDYIMDYNDGIIKFNIDTDSFDVYTADYQVIGDQSEEYPIDIYQLNNTAIPGIILAFGDNLKEGDEQVVIVEQNKRDIAKVFGGRWQLGIDLIVAAQDDDQQEKILDYAVSHLWADWQDKLTEEGINIGEFSLSGESEDLEIEVAEEYNYTAGISFQVETDWELFKPLVSEVRSMNLFYGAQGFKNNLQFEDEIKYEENQPDVRMIGSEHGMGIQIVPKCEPIVFKPSNPFTVKGLKY